MAKLYPVELAIARSLLVKEFGPNTPLLDQLASVEFDVRHMTGTGYYLDLSVATGIPRVDRINADPSEAYQTSLEPPTDLVAFTLFVRDGYLSSFEGYTFGDVPWPPNPMEDWLLFDEPTKRGCEKVK
jgi:hypothetical protein